MASVVNEAGNAVQPTAEDSALALEAATLNPDLTQNLSGVFDDPATDAYPLSSYSYFVTQCVQQQAKAQHISCDGRGKATMGTAQGAELAQFITYVACLGQKSMAALGYTPLPPNLVELDFQAAGRLPGGVTPPPPTPENCPNPTITGTLNSISPVGGLLSQTSDGGSTLPVSAPVVGNAWVLAVRVKSSSTDVASVSGGGVGGHWTKLARVGDAKANEDLEEWLGPISKTGASPVTVHFSRGVSGTPVELAAQQFTNGTGDSTVWTGDTGAAAKNDTASSTITYPTLTPALERRALCRLQPSQFELVRRCHHWIQLRKRQCEKPLHLRPQRFVRCLADRVPAEWPLSHHGGLDRGELTRPGFRWRRIELTAHTSDRPVDAPIEGRSLPCGTTRGRRGVPW